jgi:hypothetical protein
MSIGMKRPYSWAAAITALYPAMLPWDESTSIACARLIRGSSSMAKAVTPDCASASTPR